MMHFFSTTKHRPVHTGGHHGDKNDDCDIMSTVVKEDVEKGRNGWQHAAKMTRQAFLRVGTLAESTNAANEIRDARLDAMEKRIGDLGDEMPRVAQRFRKRKRRQRAIDRTSVRAGKEHANFRNECETVVGGLEKQVLTMATETSQSKATTAKCARIRRDWKANADSVERGGGFGGRRGRRGERRERRGEEMRKNDGERFRRERNSKRRERVERARLEWKAKEKNRESLPKRGKAASKAETEARAKRTWRERKTQSFAEIVEQFNREVDRKRRR